MPDLPHRANLLAVLEQQIAEKVAETDDEAAAFTQLAAEWLGYDLPAEQFTDGSGDRGVDFWFQADAGFELFQVKSHRLGAAGELQTAAFDNSGVNDLARINVMLREETPSSESNSKVRELQRQWNLALGGRRLAQPSEGIEASLNLVVFGDGLTGPAQSELDSLAASLQPEELGGVPVAFRVKLLTLDDLIVARWREDNREWRDKAARTRDSIDLTPDTAAGGEAVWLPGHNTAVFYCRTIDLITAFEELGYQIFEPNVRAHIPKSKVNAAIRASLLHRQSRKEFRFLNNGVTITCRNFTNPSQNRPSFRVFEPGVINGLQTVVALHEAYGDLDHQERDDLETGCFVLVRLLGERAIDNVSRVVLATNTQNPMQPRNLKSNTEEQILYEKLFAALGWFYERKQGAREAFTRDHRRWRTLSDYSPSDFTYQSGSGGRGVLRRVDNEELAQCWLSLIGFSEEAVHRKREIFDSTQLYELSFQTRTKHHGQSYEFKLDDSLRAAVTAAPDPHLMLISYFSREFAKAVTLSPQQARQRAIERLNLDPEDPREAVDVRLSEGLEYTQDRVLRQMSLLFVEFFGFLLFEAFGEDIHVVGRRLLGTGPLRHVRETASYDQLVSAVRHEGPRKDDVLATAWFAFRHIINELLSSPWKDSYLAASVRTRFIHHKEHTRGKIYARLHDLEAFMDRTQLTTAWTAHMPPRTRLTRYIASRIE